MLLAQNDLPRAARAIERGFRRDSNHPKTIELMETIVTKFETQVPHVDADQAIDGLRRRLAEYDAHLQSDNSKRGIDSRPADALSPVNRRK